MFCSTRPTHRNLRRLAGAAVVILAGFGLGLVSPTAQAGSGGASKFAVVSNVTWNGMRVSLWHVPGYGLYAFRIASPDALSSGWQYCQNPAGYSNSLQECMGASQPVAAKDNHAG